MAISKLTKLGEEFAKTGFKPMGDDSLRWLKNKIAEIRSPAFISAQMANEKSRKVSKLSIGKLYAFYYDPKGKESLPYYDTFPMVIVLDTHDDGFMGLNLHYLPYPYRVAFLKKLMNYAVLGQDNEIERLRVSYDILSASKRLKEFKPCLKKYLYGHVKSKLLAIQAEEYQIASLLPLQQFRKTTAGHVWSESIKGL
jgi:hypothetical protein